MTPQKVLLINDSLNHLGGAESYVESLKDLLDNHGITTRLLGSIGGIGLHESFFSRWYSRKYFYATKKVIEEFKPDIVHVHGISRALSPSVLVAASESKIPIVQTVHDYHYICPKLWMINDKNKISTTHDSMLDCIFHHLPKKNLLYSAMKYLKVQFHKLFIDKYVTHFICPSQALATWYVKRYGKYRVSYIPNFVDETIFHYSELHNFKKLLYVGRLSREKGVDLLLDAMTGVNNKYPNVTLTILGHGPAKTELEKQSDNLHLTDSVTFVGKISNSELHQYLRDSSLVIIPSRWMENCSMSLLEAIASGRPVIATDIGGIPDLVKNGKNGYLFERDSVTDLTGKIIQLLSDRDRMKKFSLEQKEISQTIYGTAHFHKLNALYMSLAN